MHLLDTSALLAHCQNESGAYHVGKILDQYRADVTVVSWLEQRIRLDLLQVQPSIVEEDVALAAGTKEAYRIRRASPTRLPALDSLIAGAARTHGLRHLHRDNHFRTIPSRLLAEEILPTK